MDEKQINELIECPVCLDRMDQTCKVLRCQHTFCRRCLDEILITKHELRCPECRALVTESLNALPTNILVMRILEGLKTKGVKPHGHSNGGRTTSPRVVASSSFRREPSSSQFSRQGSQPSAIALYNYDSDVADDLSFKKGDIINLKRKIDDNWYQGEIAGAVGHFPSNFVQVIVPLVQMPQCKALYDFDLKDEGEKDCLSFKKDEMLTVIRRVDENWLEGRKGVKIGIFPIVFVELNDTAKVLISTKSNRSILHQAVQPPSTLSTSSATTVTVTSSSTVATTMAIDTTNSVAATPQRSISAPGGVEPPSAQPSVPELVISQSGASVDVRPETTTSQVISQQSSAAATESSPVTSLTSSECSVVSSSSLPGDPVGGTHQSIVDQMYRPATESVSTDIAQAEDVSSIEHIPGPVVNPDSTSQQNKRHSYTHSAPSPCSTSPLSSGAQQNRHSAEITLPSEHGSTQTGSSSTSPVSPASNNATESLTVDTSETHLKTAQISPKQRHLSSPSSATLSESAAETSTALTAPVYMALYCYRPQKEDELELTKGDQYTVTEKCQDGWFKGACLKTGQSGVFPGNYVQLSRHSTSAFKPVHPNILNIRAKAPQTTPPAHPLHDISSSSSACVGGGDTSQQFPPPLLPRVAKLGAQGQRSKSPSVPPPLRSLSHPTTSSVLSSGGSGRFHIATPFMPSSSPSSHLAGISLSNKPSIPPPLSTTTSHVHPMPHWTSQRMPSLASIAAQPTPSLASLSAQPMPSLASVASMCATASITPPPNVVMASSHHSTAPQEKDKKEKKEKEKKGFGKLFAGKGKKSKHAHTDTADSSSTMAVLCFDNVGLAHVRSGSYPAENFVSTSDTGSLLSTTHSRKASSFDAVNTAIPPVPAKPRPKPTYRERYCCVVPYPPQTEHELSLELGDIIHVHRKRDDGWYKGTQERTGRTGLFPASFVEKL